MNSSTEENNKDLNVFDDVEIHSSTVHRENFIESDVVERYDVSDNATITILKDPGRQEYFYRVDEPQLDDFERLIRDEVSQKLVTSLKYEKRSGSAEDMEDIIKDNALGIMKNYIRPGSRTWQKIRSKIPKLSENRILTDDSIERILYYIVRDFVYYGKITPLMMDPKIEDISINKPNHPVFIYHEDYSDMEVSIAYTSDELKSFIRTLAKEIGKSISIANPEVSGSLNDGSRVELVFSDEISADGSNVTIRKFQDIPFTPVDLVEYGTFSLQQMAYLWLAIENNMSLIFAGGTASGKTTSMNAVSLFIPPKKKTITIEDTREIQLRHNNWIKSVTRDSFGGSGVGEVNMYELLRYALRQRPEYIIVGEIRGDEAQTLFQAMSTGHTTYSTMHADSVESAIHRLENRPIEVPRPMLESLDILCIQNLTYRNDEKVRRNEVLSEIIGIDSETRQIRTQNAFEWDRETDDHTPQGESYILDKIKKKRTWTDEQLQTQENVRKLVLQYLIVNNIRDYRVVTDVIRSFILNKENVIRSLLLGQLDPITDSNENVRDIEEKISNKNPTVIDRNGNEVSLEDSAEEFGIDIEEIEELRNSQSANTELEEMEPLGGEFTPDSINPDEAKLENEDDNITEPQQNQDSEIQQSDQNIDETPDKSNRTNSNPIETSEVDSIDTVDDLSEIISSEDSEDNSQQGGDKND